TSVPKSSSTNANAIRLYVGTGGSYSLASDNSDNDYATLNPPNAESDKEDGSPSWNGNGEYPVLTPDELTKITHYLPLSVGLSIKKNIHPDFALETGIVYTYLASRIKNNYPHWEADLQLHYIGIPLNLHAQLYHAPKDRWKIYAALGVMAEKGVLAHYSQNEYLYQAVENVTINEKIKGLQWSLNTSLGLDYMLNRNYGIYFEPRVSYYLDNNQPMSARTENPLVIGISAGVRYSW
ncbi:MAG: PorT family protein, partial [Dysgonamonadaceae bacterium]|nr:PorT family protein [Dysgonamonadaceae bacterium]